MTDKNPIFKFLNKLSSHKKYSGLEIVVAGESIDEIVVPNMEPKIFKKITKEYLGVHLKKYDNMVSSDYLKKLENIALMDGGEIIDNRYPKKPKYSTAQKIKKYFKNKF